MQSGPLQRQRLAVSNIAAGGLENSDEMPGKPQQQAGDAHSNPAFHRTRWMVFAAMIVGYASFYLTRNSLTYVTPVMMQAKDLKIDYTQVGGLTSILPLAYGASKFLSGVLGSRTSPTLLLAGGLMITAALNVGFGFGNTYTWFLVFWAANGLLQGLGAPACARLMTSWCNTKERGFFWSLWTGSHNVGGFLAPLLAGTAARNYGWRWGMFAPGIVGLVVGLLLLVTIKDSPQAAGFPPVETIAEKPKKGGETKKDERGLIQILTQECLKDHKVWLFAISYFFVYTVRTGVTAWFIHFLIKAKGADSAAAAVRVTGLELGGLLGSLSAGALSDYVIRKNPNAPSVGKRVQVIIAYALGTAAALAAFWFCPNVPQLQWASVALVGFFLYGPQMLVGLCGAEIVSPAAVGACQGFLGYIAYLGSSCAGLPLSILVQKYGWSSLFTTLVGASLLVVLLLAPIANAPSYAQRQLQTKAA
jgi:sugar phosphate permease